jgi:general stress protein 26
MNSKNRRFEAGGNPAQGPHPDVANPTPSPAADEDFPDQPDQHDGGRPQDQPDLDAFAARMGTDRLDADSSTDDSASPERAGQERAGQDSAGDSARDWRAPVATAVEGLASGARTVGERLRNVSQKLVPDDSSELDLAELRERVAKVRTVMLTSIDERGTLSSRPLTVQHVSQSGDVHFVVGRDADWVSSGLDAVNVAFVDGSSTWISVAGRAVLDDDSQLLDDLWNPLLDTYFPDGRAAAVVVRVESDRWEYWTAPNKLRQLVDVARARVGDDRPESGQSGTVET